MNILTGDADNLPPDGEAMKLVIQQLEEQEKALTNLFTGILTKETSHYEVSITPYDNLEKEVLFRFSNLMGIVDADDLGGVPVYMNLKATERAPVLDPKEAEKKEKSLKRVREFLRCFHRKPFMVRGKSLTPEILSKWMHRGCPIRIPEDFS